MTPFFLDTSYIIALEAVDDQYHESVLKHWKKLIPRIPPLITTSYVFNEVVTFFNNRDLHSKAVEIGNRILTSPSIKLIHVDEALFYEAWKFLKKHSDKSYSFTDCLSFVLMKRLKIQTALTFDKHFVQAGFKKLPAK